MTDPNERDRMESREGFVGLSEISDEEWETMKEESAKEQYTQVHESFGELAAEADYNDEEGY